LINASPIVPSLLLLLQPALLGLYPKDAIYIAKQDVDPTQFDLSCVKHIFAGAAILPTSVTALLTQKFPNIDGPIRQVNETNEKINK
jgi:hypothetical protein